jgi:hypothetical protein
VVAEGTAAIRDSLRWFLDRRGEITLDTKLVLGATTAEVARRQPDGTWQYVIDNAWGDQAAT